MKSAILLKLSLGLGLVSYGLVILVSQDAPMFTLALMGIMALALILISMGLMWRGWIHSDRDATHSQDPDNAFAK
jgi:uncharacterized membrane protein